MLRQISIIAPLICGAVVRQASAVDIAIENAGFEQVVLSCSPQDSCRATNSVPGWTGTGDFSSVKPTTNPDGSFPVFPTGIPEGVNAAELYYNGDLVQTLGATLQPTQPTLSSITSGLKPSLAIPFLLTGTPLNYWPAPWFWQ